MILVRFFLPKSIYSQAEREGRAEIICDLLSLPITPAKPKPPLNGSLKSNCIPGRELLICLVIVLTGAANRRGAEAGAVDSQSHGGLHPGRRPGQLGSSDEAGGADGARRKTEEGSRGHCEGWIGQDRLRRAGADGGGIDRTGSKDRFGEVEVREGTTDCARFLRMV